MQLHSIREELIHLRFATVILFSFRVDHQNPNYCLYCFDFKLHFEPWLVSKEGQE